MTYFAETVLTVTSKEKHITAVASLAVVFGTTRSVKLATPLPCDNKLPTLGIVLSTYQTEQETVSQQQNL